MIFFKFHRQKKVPHKTYKFTLFVYTLAALALLSGCAMFPAEKPSEQKRTVSTATEMHDSPYNRAVRTLINLKPKRPSTSLALWTNKKTYTIGDEIVFFFRASQDSYVTVFDIGSSGVLRIIFPNAEVQNNRVQKDKIYRVPTTESRFAIQVAGPSGLERIKAIATPRPWDISISNTAPGFSSISREEDQGTQSLLKALEKLQEHPWAESQIEIMIIENGRVHTPPGRARQVKPKPPEKPIDITGTPGRSPEVQLSEKQTNNQHPLEDPLK